MEKDAFRRIFEGTFDNALYNVILLSSCADSWNRPLINAIQHSVLYKFLSMSYEMDIVTWEEYQYLKCAIKSIFKEA